MTVPETIEEAGGEARWLDRQDGARLRYGVFGPAGAAGWCIFLPGYTEFIEKHLETVADLRARGFGVVALDWRGQGLSDRDTDDRSKGHIDRFETHLDDLDAVIDESEVLREGPAMIIGHSMGGHLTIRYCHRHPNRVSRAVAIAPMMGVTALSPSTGIMLTFFCAVGLSKYYVFGGRPYGPRRKRFEGNRLTSDPERFARMHRLMERNPDLAVADPTFGWVRAAWESIRLTRQPGWLESISTRMLVAVAGRDRIVDSAAGEAAAGRLPNATLVRIDTAEHEILGEVDPIRAELWAAIDGFLGTAQGVQM